MSNFRLLSVNGIRPLWAVLLPMFPRSILECYLAVISTSSDMWIKHCWETDHSRKSHQSANTRRTCGETRTHRHTHKHIHGHKGIWMLAHIQTIRVKDSMPSHVLYIYWSRIGHFYFTTLIYSNKQAWSWFRLNRKSTWKCLVAQIVPLVWTGTVKRQHWTSH